MSDAAEAALAYLQQCKVMTLATNGPGGLWAAAVFYASTGFELIFLSADSTRHVQNLRSQPRCAATIQQEPADWRDIQGIQLEGLVQELSGEARQRAIAAYQKKFSFLKDPPDPLRRALGKVDWFLLVPERLYYIDNRRGFAQRERVL